MITRNKNYTHSVTTVLLGSYEMAVLYKTQALNGFLSTRIATTPVSSNSMRKKLVQYFIKYSNQFDSLT